LSANPASRPPSLDQLTRTLTQALLAGGRILKAGSLAKRRVFFKSRTSPVTHVDMMSERAVIGLIRKRFPDHGFLAEESSHLKEMTARMRDKVASGLKQTLSSAGNASAGKPRYRWIIDPLDGTVNFLHGLPQSCVSIAVEREGVLLAGGVYDPFRDELFLARRGKGATLNGKRIHVSERHQIHRALLMTGFPYDHQERAAFYLSYVEAFLRTSMDIRRFGSAALDLAWVACGRIDGYWEFNLNPWDVAAGWLIVQEAGGRITDFSGRNPDVDRPTETLASNGRLHRSMLRVFRKVKPRRDPPLRRFFAK